MRWLACTLFALMILAPTSMQAGSIFVSPLDGSQVHGRTLLEIASDTPSINRVSFFVDGVLIGVARTAPWRLVHDFGDSTAPREIAAWIHSESFRATETIRVRTTGLSVHDSLNVDVVELSIRASGRQGTLSPGDLKVIENGQTQNLLSLTPSRGPMEFIFVVDQSLSMGEGKLDSALRAVTRQLSRMRDGDRASLVLFNHRVSPPRVLTSGAITGVRPSGGTSLRDALSSLEPARSSAVIVITDGADRNSATSAEAALRTIGRSRMTVYGIALGSGEGSRFLRDASVRTGGTFARAGRDSIERELSSILTDINSRYTLAYQSTNLEPGWREVSISPAHRGVTVQTSSRRYLAE